MTEEQIRELASLARTNAALAAARVNEGYTAIHRTNWPLYRAIVRRKLVTWDDWTDGEWNNATYAKVRLTPDGIKWVIHRWVPGP